MQKKVRILINKIRGAKECPCLMTPLTFLHYAGLKWMKLLTRKGAKIRYFKTVSGNHVKYICTDRSRVAISSVNFSKKAFLYNREAGYVLVNLLTVSIIIENDSKVVSYFENVFRHDWRIATPFVPEQKHSKQSIEIARNRFHAV